MSNVKSKITVGKWILQKINTANWRAGKMTGCKHYNHKDAQDSLRMMMEAVGGREQFKHQVYELAQAGMITVTYGNVNTTVEEITISAEQIDSLCEYEGVMNEKYQVAEYKKYLEQQMSKTDCEWLLSYEHVLYEKLEKGTIDANVQDENIWKLLQAIVSLQEDVWKRKLSYDVLGNSKTFEKFYEDKILTVLMHYSSKIDDMIREEYYERDEEAVGGKGIGIKDMILAEHGIITYSQTLQWKGGIVYDVGNGPVDTSLQPFGVVVNAQSLSHAKLLSLKNIKKIVTIENQANYEDRKYDSQVLYIFTHGFLSPKERGFLAQIADMAQEDISFEHWSDMDYGGIRIFQFMKKKVFSKVRPLYMDAATYEKLYAEGRAGIELTEAKRSKLEKIDAGELEELKQCILKYNKEFEQEALIDC